MELHLLGIRDVMRMTSLSKKLLYRLMQSDEFPRQVALSPRRVAWVQSEVEAWLAAKLETARGRPQN
jgi:prophage regulatory protein